MIQKIIESPMIDLPVHSDDTHLAPLLQQDQRILQTSTKCNKKYRAAGNSSHGFRFLLPQNLTIVHQAPWENHRMLRAAPLEQSVTVSTLPSVQFTTAFNVLLYDYSYLAVNTGAFPAAAYLQISPDGINWEVQSDTKTINPGILLSFVPNVIAKYARLAYRSQPPSPNTTLQIYLQGRSYN